MARLPGRINVLTKGLYQGYSSFEYERIGSFKIVDLELVKLDLLNHIWTRLGERVMMPSFGTRIPDLVFEPLDAQTLGIVEEDLKKVFNFDPRVELRSLVVTPVFDENRIEARATLFYVELDMTDVFYLNITFEGT